MKKLQLLLSLPLAYLITPVDAVYGKETGMNSDAVSKPHQDMVPDTVKDSHSKYTAKFKMKDGHVCTAILISSTAALTARHCAGTERQKYVGTIYPGASGTKTPFGYPYKGSDFYQYRSDGQVTFHQKNPALLRTTLPTHEGQSGSGVFLKNGELTGILITRTQNYEGNILPFTKEIAEWVNKNAN
ncbi:trypsin-like serine protease [Staphylococcus pseudintermedius]|uniref:trypsin-like serine protease n=1 Tax=Staphylococcus pseudintermedius TaxID=283734 RepID=UPI001BDDFC54|nr:trypsin-like serine protease [Staphylococcus pseudintermedius]